MSVSAAHFKEVTNGYEKRSDGLWVHKGKLDAGHLRATAWMPPNTGAGLESGFIGSGASSAGQILAYDRDAAAYRDLNIYAKSINLLPQGGLVSLPNGSISTAMLAPGAAQLTIGTYFNAPTFSTTTTSVWTNTPMTTGSIACTGAQCRIEGTVGAYHSVATGAWFVGLMLDGAYLANMALAYSPGVNLAVTASFTIYYTPTAANHTFSVGLDNLTAGTLTISPSFTSSLYVTEQRR